MSNNFLSKFNPSPAPEVMGTPRNDPKLLDILRRYDESDDPGSMLILAAYEAGKLAQPDPWVDVKVGLPKDEVAKLVFVQETLCSFTAYYDGCDWLSFEPNGRSTVIWGVTHWRELPAPPETRATEGNDAKEKV